MTIIIEPKRVRDAEKRNRGSGFRGDTLPLPETTPHPMRVCPECGQAGTYLVLCSHALTLHPPRGLRGNIHGRGKAPKTTEDLAAAWIRDTDTRTTPAPPENKRG